MVFGEKEMIYFDNVILAQVEVLLKSTYVGLYTRISRISTLILGKAKAQTRSANLYVKLKNLESAFFTGEKFDFYRLQIIE